MIPGVTTKSDREIDRFTGGVRLKMSFLAGKKTRELYHARVLRALRTHSLPRGGSLTRGSNGMAPKPPADEGVPLLRARDAAPSGFSGFSARSILLGAVCACACACGCDAGGARGVLLPRGRGLPRLLG